MRILIACRMLDGVAGGVERSAVGLLNALAGRGHQVHLLSWDRRGAQAYYPLAPSVTWHCLDMGDATQRASFGQRLRRLWRIRRLVSKGVRPDIIIGFQHGPFLALAVALLGTGHPVVAAERNAPHRLDHLKAGRRRELLFQTFRLASRVFVQFESYRARYPSYLHRRIRVIPNAVSPAERLADPVGSPGRKTLLSVARLGYQKNPQCLVRAFAQVADDHPEWVLRLVGEGEDRADVSALADRLGVGERVEMPGARKDIESEYQAAQLFALASRWEGFPNAVAEAMAHGLPAIGFAGCAGIADLIEHRGNGLLAPGNGDAEALGAVLKIAMDDAGLRSRFGSAGLGVSKRYRPKEVWGVWENALDEIAPPAS